MKKNKGQSLVEFVAMAFLLFALVFFGTIEFGDKIADFFAGSDPGKTYNNSRIMRYENPNDLVSNVKVYFDGTEIEPPVEKVIKTSGAYIQTSGSSGRIAQMGMITKEYVTQIQKLTNYGVPAETNLNNTLDTYESTLENGATGFLDEHNNYADDEVLEKKLNMIEMAIELNQSGLVTQLETDLNNYLSQLPAGNGKDLIETLTKDILNFSEFVEYNLDPSLYLKYLGEEKRPNDPIQDLDLHDAIKVSLGGMTTDEKLNLAGLVEVEHTGSYSQASPSAYNGERMCSAFGGNMISDEECEIPAP